MIAEWKKSTLIGQSDVELCSNCNHSPKPIAYPACDYWCGRYCANCGAKMKNPHYHFIEADYD